MSSQYYQVEAVHTTDFDKDDYGNEWYSVKFNGVADNALWKAKNRPEAGARVYGHIERTKSGKGWRFKRDPVPEGYDEQTAPIEPESAAPQPDTSTQLDRIEEKLDKLLGGDIVYPVDQDE